MLYRDNLWSVHLNNICSSYTPICKIWIYHEDMLEIVETSLPLFMNITIDKLQNLNWTKHFLDVRILWNMIKMIYAFIRST